MKKTSNYNLNLYEVNDLANLTDGYNNSMNTLDTTIKTVSNSVSAETTRATKAESTLTTNLNAEITRAKAAESTLTSNLNSEVTRAKAAENTNADAVESEKLRAESVENRIGVANTQLYHYGAFRIDDYENMTQAQGFCIIGNRLICCLCDSENYNGKIVEIDYQTGKVLNVTDVLLGHMNSIAYNHNDNYIYTTDTKINKIDSKTFKTIESFSLDFQPQAICFDPKSDASYICERVDDNVMKLYSFDYVNKTTKAIGTFNYQLDSITHTPFSRRNGSQNMVCYNGNIWYLAAGDLSQTMLQINPKDASIIQAISMNQVSYIYKIVEAESVCFTADGDIFVYSKGNIESVTDNGYAVLSYFNLYGNKCTNNYTYAYSSAERWAHLQGEFDSICRDGSSAYPFTSLEECIGAIKLGAFEGVRLNSDATVKNNITSVEFPLYIRLDGYKLTIEASVLQFGTLNIDGTTSSSRTSALQVNNNIQFTAFIYEITHLSVNSDYTMTFMLGVLVADHVTGGSFDGGNKTGLFKANTVTGGTFNNFLTN